MPTLKDQAVILHRYEYSESSWILKVQCREQGFVSLVAKGARRPKSPVHAILDPLNKVDLVFSYRPGRDLHTLTQASMVSSHSSMREDLHKSALGTLMAEVLLRLQVEGEGHEEMFEMLANALGWLEKKAQLEVTEGSRLFLRYILMICENLGFGFQTEYCTLCQKPLKNPIKVICLDTRQGGFQGSCCHGDMAKVEAEVSFLHSILVRQKANTMDAQVVQSSEDQMLTFLEHHLDIPIKLKSLDWLRSVRGMA